MSIMDRIRARQQTVVTPLSAAPPKHEPEMLYIGCVDARLDPIEDIGIGKGKALIYRNIGALVLKDKRESRQLHRSEMSADVEIPQSVSVGAVLEFFLKHIPMPPDNVKHIVISGHTDCGGIRACHHGVYKENDHYLPLYLQSLKDVRTRIMDEAKSKGWDELQTLHALEKESVRQSIANLLSYPAVRQAIDEGTLQLHGWVIDTGTKLISEMHPQTGEFEPMGL